MGELIKIFSWKVSLVELDQKEKKEQGVQLRFLILHENCGNLIWYLHGILSVQICNNSEPDRS